MFAFLIRLLRGLKMNSSGKLVFHGQHFRVRAGFLHSSLQAPSSPSHNLRFKTSPLLSCYIISCAFHLIVIYAGNNAHPSNLTQTERLRVIRACYQIWSLTRCDENTARAGVCSLRPRELFYFLELVQWARVTQFLKKDIWSLFYIGKGTKVAVPKLYSNTYNSVAPIFQTITYYDDSVGLSVIWNHRQDDRKNLICDRPLLNLRWDVRAERLDHL